MPLVRAAVSSDTLLLELRLPYTRARFGLAPRPGASGKLPPVASF